MQLKSRLSFILCFCSVIVAKSQFVIDSVKVDSIQQIKELPPIEANFLFSYYEQDGTKSPVTGGIGDEALTDLVGKITIVVPISKKTTFHLMAGLDSYSSASTDNINNEFDLYAETSASSKDQRKYADLGVSFNNEKRRLTYAATIGYSNEWDVQSYNGEIGITKLSKNKNTLFILKSSIYHDLWKMVYPSELRWKYQAISKNDDDDYNKDIRNSFNGTFSIQQDITHRLKGAVTIEPAYQSGLLSTPFHRVYFNGIESHDIEKLPDNRFKIPLGFHLNYYINKFLVSRLYYRFYKDDFGITAHTARIELPFKPIRAITIAPFYRFHTQSASKFFQPFGSHSLDDEFYTSDYDLSNIKTNRVGLELRWSPAFVSDSQKKRLVLKKVSVRGSQYFRHHENELILKSFIVALGIDFRIQ